MIHCTKYNIQLKYWISVAILVAWPHGTSINKLIVLCIICQTTDLSVSPRLPMVCHHVRSFQNSCNYICSCATCILLSVVTCSYKGTSYHITGNFQGMKFLQISWLILSSWKNIVNVRASSSIINIDCGTNNHSNIVVLLRFINVWSHLVDK